MRVVVEAGSRLHAGFHVVKDRYNKIDWMGAGFYVYEPRVVIEASECDGPGIEAGEFTNNVEKVAEKLGFNGCIRVRQAPPRHAGLGSTTQVMLGTYQAISLLQGRKITPDQIIEIGINQLGRRIGSTVGTVLYAYGGFVSGVGLPIPAGYSPLRLALPEHWRFIIIIPETTRGMSEKGEDLLLSSLPEPPDRITYSFHKGFHLLLIGIIRHNLDILMQGLRLVQTATGEYFSRIQGGAYRRDLMVLADEASRDGIFLAQSSWGPTLYTITEKEAAESDAKTLKMLMKEIGLDGTIIIADPRNEGARAVLEQ